MPAMQLDNPASMAKWHRQTAADLASVGRHAAARERMEKARLCEAEIGNVNCEVCHRPLTDPISIKRGVGPDCLGKVS